MVSFLDKSNLVWYDLIWFDSIWFDLIWFVASRNEMIKTLSYSVILINLHCACCFCCFCIRLSLCAFVYTRLPLVLLPLLQPVQYNSSCSWRTRGHAKTTGTKTFVCFFFRYLCSVLEASLSLLYCFCIAFALLSYCFCILLSIFVPTPKSRKPHYGSHVWIHQTIVGTVVFLAWFETFGLFLLGFVVWIVVWIVV